MPDSLTISALARELGVTTRTIRFYEEQGLIDPERRGQERIYSDADRATLVLILRAKSLGFTLGECQTLLSLVSHDQYHLDQSDLMQRREEIEGLRERLEEQRASIAALTETLDDTDEQLLQRISRLQRPKNFSLSSDLQLDLGFSSDENDKEKD